MSFKKIEISEITFFDADGNELIGAGAHGILGNFATASRLESDPFPPSRSGGVHRDPLGPLSQNRRRISGWELESQIWGPPPF